jgi:hypothetical protein
MSQPIKCKVKILNHTKQLSITFDIKNSVTLLKDLHNITFNDNNKAYSFDTENMYTNIPMQEVNYIIIHNLITLNTNSNIFLERTTEMIRCMIIFKFFQFNQKQYKQTNGLAVGVPTSVLLAEIFLQFLEHNQIFHIVCKRKTVRHFRYFNDILIMHNNQVAQIQNIHNNFNLIYLTKIYC